MASVLGDVSDFFQDTVLSEEVVERPEPLTFNENGLLKRFFDSAFFCEWIAVTYLYKHSSGPVRDYLCDRMYMLPVDGLQEYLYQICYLAVNRPSPSLDKILNHIGSKSLHCCLRVQWFLAAEAFDKGDEPRLAQMRQQISALALSSPFPSLKCPRPPRDNFFGSQKVFQLMSSASRKLLPMAGSISVAKSGSAVVAVLPATRPLTSALLGKDKGSVLGSVLESKSYTQVATAEERAGHDEGSKVSQNDDYDVDDEVIVHEELSGHDKSISEAFLRRIFGDKTRGAQDGDQEDKKEEREGFFRRLFRDKSESSMPVSKHNSDVTVGELTIVTEGDEGDEDDLDGRVLHKEAGESSSAAAGSSLPSPHEGILTRLFKGEDAAAVADTSGSLQDRDPFFKWLFREAQQHQQQAAQRSAEGNHEVSTNENFISGGDEDEVGESFFRRLLKGGTQQQAAPVSSGAQEKTDGQEKDSVVLEERSEGKARQDSSAEEEHEGHLERQNEGTIFRRLFWGRSDGMSREVELLIEGDKGRGFTSSVREKSSSTNTGNILSASEREKAPVERSVSESQGEQPRRPPGGLLPTLDHDRTVVPWATGRVADADGQDGSTLSSAAGSEHARDTTNLMPRAHTDSTFLAKLLHLGQGSDRQDAGGLDSPQAWLRRQAQGGSSLNGDQEEGGWAQQEHNEVAGHSRSQSISGDLRGRILRKAGTASGQEDHEHKTNKPSSRVSSPDRSMLQLLYQSTVAGAAGAVASAAGAASGARHLVGEAASQAASMVPPISTLRKKASLDSESSAGSRAPGDKKRAVASPPEAHQAEHAGLPGTSIAHSQEVPARAKSSLGFGISSPEKGFFSKLYAGHRRGGGSPGTTPPAVLVPPAPERMVAMERGETSGAVGSGEATGGAGSLGSSAVAEAGGAREGAGGSAAGAAGIAASQSLFIRRLFKGTEEASGSGSHPTNSVGHSHSVGLPSSAHQSGKVVPPPPPLLLGQDEGSHSSSNASASAPHQFRAAVSASEYIPLVDAPVVKKASGLERLISKGASLLTTTAGAAAEHGKGGREGAAGVSAAAASHEESLIAARLQASGAVESSTMGGSDAADKGASSSSSVVATAAAAAASARTSPTAPLTDASEAAHQAPPSRQGSQPFSRSSVLSFLSGGRASGPPSTEMRVASGPSSGACSPPVEATAAPQVTRGSATGNAGAAASGGRQGLEEDSGGGAAGTELAPTATVSSTVSEDSSPDTAAAVWPVLNASSLLSAFAMKKAVPAAAASLSAASDASAVTSGAPSEGPSPSNRAMSLPVSPSEAIAQQSAAPPVDAARGDGTAAVAASLAFSASGLLSAFAGAAGKRSVAAPTVAGAGAGAGAGVETVGAEGAGRREAASRATGNTLSNAGGAAEALVGEAAVVDTAAAAAHCQAESGPAGFDTDRKTSAAKHRGQQAAGATLAEEEPAEASTAVASAAPAAASVAGTGAAAGASDRLPYPAVKLPRYPSFAIRPGTVPATLDFVKALGDISFGLVHVFPGDRQTELRESLAELNAHLASMPATEGVLFPLSRGHLRVVRIVEEDALLLSSRDRVPFMLFLEVLDCQPLATRKAAGEAAPIASSLHDFPAPWRLPRKGIPLSTNHPVVFRPPPWALHMFMSREDPMTNPSSLTLSRTLSDVALNRAVASLYARMKLVDVSIEVRKRKAKRTARQVESSSSSGTAICESQGVPGPSPLRGAAALAGGSASSAEHAADDSGAGATPGLSWSLQSNREAAAAAAVVTGSATVPFPQSLSQEEAGKQAGEGGREGGQVSAGAHGGLKGPEEGDERGEEWEGSVASDLPESGEVGGESQEGDAALDEEQEEYVTVKLVAVPGVTLDDVAALQDSMLGLHRRVPSSLAIAHVRAATEHGQEPPPGLPTTTSTGASASEAACAEGSEAKQRHPLDESWQERKERIRKASKFGSSPDWDLKSVIVKSGDDCRQEHFAVQLVAHFWDIFQEAGLPLWLRPYEVLVTSANSAIIETITDAVSIHSLKSRNPHLATLRQWFEERFGDGTPEFRGAQQNFVESMAAYSIVTYFLQVKDRHNGNILLDRQGHIIHIDFGFMLSNSPGSVNFESAPFKLTRELLEVMDSDAEGSPSEAFDYFKVLCIQGFLTCRKHAERILLLVEMMQHTRSPCFKAGTRVLHNLRKRFHLTLTEEQCVALVLSLISKSLDSWRSRQYDYYQKVLNGIL